VPADYLAVDPALADLGELRAAVIAKLPVSFFTSQNERSEALLSWAENASRRSRVLVDFSDDLAAAAAMYSEPRLREVQKRLLHACAATVPAAALRESLLEDARHGVTVIEDPYESSTAATPRFAPAATLRLAWFGVFGEPLRPYIETQFAAIARRLAPRAVELAFVTSAHAAPLVLDMADALSALSPSFRLRHVEWSLDAARRSIEDADIVVLPQDAGSAWGRVKSHNRLVETIRAGRLAVASPIPAYLELAEFAWVGEDLAAGIEWALAHPTVAEGRIVAGQAYVANRFAPERIGALWARALGL
jgi:hypothetical protein